MLNRRSLLARSAGLACAGLLADRFAPVIIGEAHAADEPCYLSAGELLARFRSREISPVEVLEAQIRRIEALNAGVNCITYRHFDEARAGAKASEVRYRAGEPRPLDGLTIAVKDEYAVKGWVTTMGTLMLKDAPPDTADHPVIERLRAAGAVFHIQTTVPELYSWMTTATRLWGVTRNPWNFAFSPGGSSGGSGAALAAGFTTLALGSDMGGSIRIPASQCGLYGFKAPFGRIPTSEVPYETEGPLARTFDDLNLLTQHMVGPHPAVHSSLRPRLDFPASYDDIAGWTLAYDPGAGLTPLDPAVTAAIEQALQQLEGQGARIERVDLGFRAGDMPVFLAGLFSTSMGGMLGEAAAHREKLTPYVAQMLDGVKGRLGPQALVAAEDVLATYHRSVQEKVFTRGFKALVMPTLGTPLIPAAHGMDPASDAVRIGGTAVKGLSFALTWPWNLLGRYPVVAAPAGMGPQNMPVGLQIVADTLDDVTAFQVAAAHARGAPRFYAGTLFPDFRSG
ncbi:amidase [Ancylobacter sp. 6x-1]|uniref:Indoleacetamide hydrolase n=1 Tax=Ancylobacter crimeensis TaxID=2579147 RepID=A0ABT0DCZ5_9HYPH|nr:amidase [Ancylobacter crimeensis]MCK0197836.1 amidase [Ancylobacter crimeensis]